MKVKAIRTGFIYHIRRREGDVFTLKSIKSSDGKRTIPAEAQFSPKWMERVHDEMPERVTTAQQALTRDHDVTIAERASARKSDPEDDSGRAQTEEEVI